MKHFWLKKSECTACAACANICPRNAIHMCSDKYGFFYPKITDDCIECNACQIVCERRNNYSTQNAYIPTTFAAWTKDETLRFTSTSGGAFSELARGVLRQGGYIVGAQYREDNMVEHVVVKDQDELEKIKQSKYIQSEIGLVFRNVKQLLSERLVAFCGTPCQVAGLYAYLGKKYDNLITIDFICRGVNSPKAYRAWLDEIEECNQRKIKHVWFKYKNKGWKQSPRCTRIDFEDGQHLVFSEDKNLFMEGYLGPNLYIRPSCGNCEFKGVPRQADITLADFWKVDSSLDDDKGTSMLLINSKKGHELFEKVKENMIVIQRTFEEISDGNVCFESSVAINHKSKKFLKSLDYMPFSKAFKIYSKRTFWDKVVGRLKR